MPDDRFRPCVFDAREGQTIPTRQASITAWQAHPVLSTRVAPGIYPAKCGDGGHALSMPPAVLLGVCVDSVASAVAAERAEPIAWNSAAAQPSRGATPRAA